MHQSFCFQTRYYHCPCGHSIPCPDHAPPEKPFAHDFWTLPGTGATLILQMNLRGLPYTWPPRFHRFHDWVAAKLGFTSSTSGWCNMILSKSTDHKAAFDRFFSFSTNFSASLDDSLCFNLAHFYLSDVGSIAAQILVAHMAGLHGGDFAVTEQAQENLGAVSM